MRGWAEPLRFRGSGESHVCRNDGRQTGILLSPDDYRRLEEEIGPCGAAEIFGASVVAQFSTVAAAVAVAVNRARIGLQMPVFRGRAHQAPSVTFVARAIAACRTTVGPQDLAFAAILTSGAARKKKARPQSKPRRFFGGVARCTEMTTSFG